MMWGKHYRQMYKGSMIGSGAVVFAVMGYVIANQEPVLVGCDRVCMVELNPDLLGFILGEKAEDVEKAIRYLEGPDPRSHTKGEDGRRLVRVGEYDYRVVNGMKYLTIRNDEDRREQNRLAQEKHRQKMNDMTPEERAAYDAWKEKAYRKHRKIGVRAAGRNGAIAGGTQAVNDGMADAADGVEAEKAEDIL